MGRLTGIEKRYNIEKELSHRLTRQNKEENCMKNI